MERSAILAQGDTIRHDDLMLTRAFDDIGPPASAVASEPAPRLAGSVKLVEIERQVVRHVLEQSGWNVSRAAMDLGITRDKLRTRMERYQLTRPGK